MSRKRKMSAAEKHKRREKRRARRQARVNAEGPARQHWERRRAGKANSAPELRNRPSLAGIEDYLIGGPS